MLGSPADRRLVRAINRATVLRLIKQEGPISRAAIARSTGLSQVTVGAITAELIARRLVSEGAQAPSTGGRPATPLHLNVDSYHVVGIKLMEDHLVAAVTNLDAQVLAEGERPLGKPNPRAVLGVAGQLVRTLASKARVDPSRLLGVGIGMAGVVDGREGVCRYSPFLDWRDVPVADLAEEILRVPVMVENDVNTLALAERWYGAGREVDDFLLVTVGRGVGLGIVTEGRLHRGSRGGAGEFGHTVVDGSDRPCPCGMTGCLEATVSEPALLQAARELLGPSGPAPATPEELYRLAPQEPGLVELFAQAGRMLGRGLANLINLFAPGLVIVSGEGIRAGELLFGPMREELQGLVFEGLRASYEFVVEPLPDAAWARGAASLVLGEVFDTPIGTRAVLLWEQEAVS